MSQVGHCSRIASRIVILLSLAAPLWRDADAGPDSSRPDVASARSVAAAAAVAPVANADPRDPRGWTWDAILAASKQHGTVEAPYRTNGASTGAPQFRSAFERPKTQQGISLGVLEDNRVRRANATTSSTGRMHVPDGETIGLMVDGQMMGASGAAPADGYIQQTHTRTSNTTTTTITQTHHSVHETLTTSIPIVKPRAVGDGAAMLSYGSEDGPSVYASAMLPALRTSERDELKQLGEALEFFVSKLDTQRMSHLRLDDRDAVARLMSLLEEEQGVYDLFFDEIIRQVGTQCRERGEMLGKIRGYYANLLLRVPMHLYALQSELTAQQKLNHTLQEEQRQQREKSFAISVELGAYTHRFKEAAHELEMVKDLLSRAEHEKDRARAMFTQFKEEWDIQRSTLEEQVAVLKEEREDYLATASATATALQKSKQPNLLVHSLLDDSDSDEERINARLNFLKDMEKDDDTELLSATILQIERDQLKDGADSSAGASSAAGEKDRVKSSPKPPQSQVVVKAQPYGGDIAARSSGSDDDGATGTGARVGLLSPQSNALAHLEADSAHRAAVMEYRKNHPEASDSESAQQAALLEERKAHQDSAKQKNLERREKERVAARAAAAILPLKHGELAARAQSPLLITTPIRQGGLSALPDFGLGDGKDAGYFGVQASPTNAAAPVQMTAEERRRANAAAVAAASLRSELKEFRKLSLSRSMKEAREAEEVIVRQWAKQIGEETEREERINLLQKTVPTLKRESIQDLVSSSLFSSSPAASALVPLLIDFFMRVEEYPFNQPEMICLRRHFPEGVVIQSGEADVAPTTPAARSDDENASRSTSPAGAPRAQPPVLIDDGGWRDAVNAELLRRRLDNVAEVLFSREMDRKVELSRLLDQMSEAERTELDEVEKPKIALEIPPEESLTHRRSAQRRHSASPPKIDPNDSQQDITDMFRATDQLGSVRRASMRASLDAQTAAAQISSALHAATMNDVAAANIGLASSRSAAGASVKRLSTKQQKERRKKRESQRSNHSQRSSRTATPEVGEQHDDGGSSSNTSTANTPRRTTSGMRSITGGSSARSRTNSSATVDKTSTPTTPRARVTLLDMTDKRSSTSRRGTATDLSLTDSSATAGGKKLTKRGSTRDLSKRSTLTKSDSLGSVGSSSSLKAGADHVRRKSSRAMPGESGGEASKAEQQQQTPKLTAALLAAANELNRPSLDLSSNSHHAVSSGALPSPRSIEFTMHGEISPQTRRIMRRSLGGDEEVNVVTNAQSHLSSHATTSSSALQSEEQQEREQARLMREQMEADGEAHDERVRKSATKSTDPDSVQFQDSSASTTTADVAAAPNPLVERAKKFDDITSRRATLPSMVDASQPLLPREVPPQLTRPKSIHTTAVPANAAAKAGAPYKQPVKVHTHHRHHSRMEHLSNPQSASSTPRQRPLAGGQETHPILTLSSEHALAANDPRANDDDELVYRTEDQEPEGAVGMGGAGSATTQSSGSPELVSLGSSATKANVPRRTLADSSHPQSFYDASQLLPVSKIIVAMPGGVSGGNAGPGGGKGKEKKEVKVETQRERELQLVVQDLIAQNELLHAQRQALAQLHGVKDTGAPALPEQLGNFAANSPEARALLQIGQHTMTAASAKATVESRVTTEKQNALLAKVNDYLQAYRAARKNASLHGGSNPAAAAALNPNPPVSAPFVDSSADASLSNPEALTAATARTVLSGSKNLLSHSRFLHLLKHSASKVGRGEREEMEERGEKPKFEGFESKEEHGHTTGAGDMSSRVGQAGSRASAHSASTSLSFQPGTSHVTFQTFSLSWLVKWLRGVYDAKLSRDDLCRKEQAPLQRFPEFILEVQRKKYGLESLSARKTWDIVNSLVKYRDTDREIGMFVEFLEESRPLDELILFLRTRAVVMASTVGIRWPGHLLDRGNKSCCEYISLCRARDVLSTIFSESSNMQDDVYREVLNVAITWNQMSDPISKARWETLLPGRNAQVDERCVLLTDFIERILNQFRAIELQLRHHQWAEDLWESSVGMTRNGGANEEDHPQIMGGEPRMDFSSFQQVFSLAEPRYSPREIAQLYSNVTRNAGLKTVSKSLFKRLIHQLMNSGVMFPLLQHAGYEQATLVRMIVRHWNGFKEFYTYLQTSLSHSDQPHDLACANHLRQIRYALETELSKAAGGQTGGGLNGEDGLGSATRRLVAVYRGMLNVISSHQSAFMLVPLETPLNILHTELKTLQHVILQRHRLHDTNEARVDAWLESLATLDSDQRVSDATLGVPTRLTTAELRSSLQQREQEALASPNSDLNASDFSRSSSISHHNLSHYRGANTSSSWTTPDTEMRRHFEQHERNVKQGIVVQPQPGR